MPPLAGMDIGTTGIKVSVFDDANRPTVVETEYGGKSWPSYVFLAQDGKVSVGQDAVEQGIIYPSQVAFGWKMHLGDNTKRYFKETACASDVVAMALGPIVKQTEKKLGMKLDGVVATHPANFTDIQRQGLLDGFAKAGLNVLETIPEPVAAAYAYACKDRAGKGRESLYLCNDLGGGTLDITVLQIMNGVAKPISTEGIPHLGGRDFTNVLKGLLLEKASKDAGKVIELDKLSPQQAFELNEKAERAKHSLSGQPSTKVTLDCGGKSRLYEISHKEFEAAYAPLVQQMLACLDKTMQVANKSWKDLEKLVLAGGPFLNLRLQEVVGLHTGIVGSVEMDPTSLVSFGAMQYAAELARGKAGVISDERMRLKKATDHDLGINIIDESANASESICSVIVPKNTAVPNILVDCFRLQRASQQFCDILVLQAPQGTPLSKCAVIGEIHLKDLPPEPYRTARIEVTFSLDENAIVTVTAKDLLSGISQTVGVKINSPKAA